MLAPIYITAVSIAIACVFLYFPNYVSFGKFAIGISDNREVDCLNFVKQNAINGNASSVLEAIDHFGWKQNFLMNVGDVKGEILRNALTSAHKPIVHALELGAYVGYSGVLIGNELAKKEAANGGEQGSPHLTSVEISENNAAIAREMLQVAGLSSRVDVVVGTVTSVLKSHMQLHGIPAFDFVFIDHHKGSYLSDLQYLMDEGLLAADGAVIVADNILFPGAPEYRRFVRTDRRFETVEHRSQLEYLALIPDIVTVSHYLPSTEEV